MHVLSNNGYSIHSLSKISGVSYATAWRNLIKAANIETDTFTSALINDFEFIKKDVTGILLYGSHAKGSADRRSDIDICIVKPRSRMILERIYAKLGDKYDVKIFEDLPAYIK
ncbi:MAG: nucleotidyltransferase domain-containing protein [Candidatus Methanoperedens sp.]|nr:MAG: nucleotidyltransferase domain-containing protein [Candidatus Methanoperedens sp.]